MEFKSSGFLLQIDFFSHLANFKACTPLVYPVESLENVAPEGIASQSSTAFLGVASRAVDGNRDPEYSHGSCTHTGGEPNPWWSLLLPVVYRVSTVSITNRKVASERLNNAEILIGNSLENNGKNNPRCAVISSIPPGGTKSFNCTGMTGRMLTVKISTSYGLLTMCELEIYGG
uniref:Fucolectin tachylectin-4 pentraxin-1 domain-containing protein n=1 Tax=Xiphophorus couchianus TaxID=32473 RepID=A0A3B5MV99_9TELE